MQIIHIDLHETHDWIRIECVLTINTTANCKSINDACVQVALTLLAVLQLCNSAIKHSYSTIPYAGQGSMSSPSKRKAIPNLLVCTVLLQLNECSLVLYKEFTQFHRAMPKNTLCLHLMYTDVQTTPITAVLIQHRQYINCVLSINK